MFIDRRMFFRSHLTSLNSRLSFRIILAIGEATAKKCNGSSCDGENNEEKLQRIKSSLDLFVLLHQDKRTKNNILGLKKKSF